jgi:hypothetical protein
MHTEACELGCLFVGQGGAERSDPDVAPAAGQGDRNGIHGAFHEHRDLPIGELVLKYPEQLRALVDSGVRPY